METYLAEHSAENKRRVQDLGNALIDNSIMVDIVRRELDEFLRKYESMESEVSNMELYSEHFLFFFQFTAIIIILNLGMPL